MTVVVEADDDAARRIEANLYKLVNVLRVEDIDAQAPTIVRELALDQGARRRRDARPSVMQLCEVFRARVVDVGPEALVVEITGDADKIDGLVDVLRPVRRRRDGAHRRGRDGAQRRGRRSRIALRVDGDPPRRRDIQRHA